MYVLVDNQEKLMKEALIKAKSYRKLAKLIPIPRASLLRYTQGDAIPKLRFEEIINFLDLKEKNLKFELLEENWGQKLGGKNSVTSKKKNGSFAIQLQKAQEKGAKTLKKWHQVSKKNNPKEYHLIQYSRFKKIGGYKHLTKNNESVRNILEKETADKLFNEKVSYRYEPLVNIGKRYFFPDFLIENKIIIECTMWRGETKAYKLKEKIKWLSKKYEVYVLIPKKLEKYYKSLKKCLIFDVKEIKEIKSPGSSAR